MGRRTRNAAACAVLACALVVAGPATSATKQPKWTTKCAELNKVYPHGVGRANAMDRVKGKGKPVTTFKRSTKLYNEAMQWNKRLDADKDGVACEKH
jgi:hypothetical protein